MIYLDPPRKYPNLPGRLISHMVADSEKELHEFAKKIGLQRKWYQKQHYDVFGQPLLRALAEGARIVGYWECARRRKQMIVEEMRK